MTDRFQITELLRCICGMRVFSVLDTVEGDTIRAHVGNLNPHDKAHMAVAAFLKQERVEGQTWREQVGEMPMFDRAADGLEALLDEITTLRDEKDAAVREMHSRELHHFEEEQRSAQLEAALADRDARIKAALAMADEFEYVSDVDLRLALSGPAVPVPQDNPETTREALARKCRDFVSLRHEPELTKIAEAFADAILAAFDVRPKNGEKP